MLYNGRAIEVTQNGAIMQGRGFHIVLIGIFFMLSTTVNAATQNDSGNISSSDTQPSGMQQQIDAMQKRLDELENRHQSLHSRATEGQPDLPNVAEDDSNKKHEESSEINEKITELAEKRLYTMAPYGHTLLGNIGGTAVITSPFIHSRYDFRGSGLIVNYSSINKDVSSLMQRRDFYNQMRDMGYSMPAYPILELSGEGEGEFRQFRLFNGRHGNDFNLTDAELDMQALVNDWFLGFITFAYDCTPTSSGNRIFNSNVFVDNGFITLGNLNKIPYYGTIGQVYVPFGQFDSYLISDPMNKTLFRTKARSLTLGYQSLDVDGPYAALFGFRGPTRRGKFEPDATSRKFSSHINTFGLNAGYNYSVGAISGLLGGSVITNVANSLGMQATGGRIFRGFAASSATQVLNHRVPGYDLRAEIYYQPFSFITEYSGSARSFSPRDLTFNGSGARPAAYHLEAVYKFDMFRRPTNVALGYGRSFESLALNVPQRRAAITLNTAFWKNTLASLEYRHDVNYSRDDTASGNRGPTFGPLGKIQNVLTAHFDIYF